MTSFYSKTELDAIGFRSYGKNVLISRKASIYGAEHICIGNDVRIDDFCVLSGTITLGNFIHISAYSCLYGGDSGIIMKDYSTLSSRCAVYAISDDYSGYAMTNPMIPEKYRSVISQKVVIEKHAIIGSGSTILPGVIISEGVAVGSMSLVNRTLEPWRIYVGIPCKMIKERENRVVRLEEQFVKEGVLNNE